MALTLTSSEFKQDEKIPTKFTCDGDDVSPPLAWQEVPDKTQSYVLIMDDPDAPMGTWDHWILYNIPGSWQEIPEKLDAKKANIDQGNNSWKRADYGGPCPPSGIHRYVFKLFALDNQINLPEGSTKHEVRNAMRGHVLDHAELVGVYSR